MSSVPRILFALSGIMIIAYYSFNFGILLLLLSIFEYLIYIGVFRKVVFSRWILHDSDIFYLEYKGEYSKIGNTIKNLSETINNLHLDRKNWNTFGFYYDNPKVVDPKKCRAVVGLIYTNEKYYQENQLLNKEIFNNLIKEGLEHVKLKQADLLISKFPYVNNLSFFVAIIKFYRNLTKNLEQNEFLSKFMIESDFEFKNSVEIYKENDLIFGIPLEKSEQFFLYTGKNEQKNTIN